jgi:very-short-patch-repair endonuclease
MNYRDKDIGFEFYRGDVPMVLIEGKTPQYRYAIIQKEFLEEHLINKDTARSTFTREWGLNNRIVKASLTHWGLDQSNYFKERYKDHPIYPHLMLSTPQGSGRPYLYLDKVFFVNHWIRLEASSVHDFSNKLIIPSKIIRRTIEHFSIDTSELSIQVREKEFGLTSEHPSRVVGLLTSHPDPYGLFTKIKETYPLIDSEPQILADSLVDLSLTLANYRLVFTELAQLIRMRIRREDITFKLVTNLTELVVYQELDRLGISFMYQQKLDGSNRVFDFVIPDTKLIIEVDGGAHNVAFDKEKTFLAKSHGYTLERLIFSKSVTREKNRTKILGLLNKILTKNRKNEDI